MRSSIARLIVLLALVGGVLVGLPTSAGGASVTIRATATFKWNPDFKHVVKGTKVIWRNPTSITHRVDAYGANWNKFTAISPGGSTSRIFRKSGVYKYRCSIQGHSTLQNGVCNGMCGKIHVTA